MIEKIKNFKIVPSDEWREYDLKITLKPCFKCNHMCWFCEEYNNNTKMWSKHHCDLVIEKLLEIPLSRKRLFFYFYGGEPTLNKHWKYLTEKIITSFRDRELFIQTQTNLSLSKSRLREYLHDVNNIKQSHHKVDICSSYHIGKQNVQTFIEKLNICKAYNAQGLCFFSTELPKRTQCIHEFTKLVAEFGSKIKLRFTEVEGMLYKKTPGYEEYLKDSYLTGDDNGKSLEFRYWLREFPEWRNHFEEGWNFDVDGTIYNFSEVSGYNIHKKFKYMKCECGTKGIVIDHNLEVYHCNDDYYNNLNSTHILDLDLSTYLNKNVRCLNSACYDGLDYIKYR